MDPELPEQRPDTGPLKLAETLRERALSGDMRAAIFYVRAAAGAH